MADFSIDELNATQAGTATSDTLKNIANTARNAACSFFKAYPSVIIPNPAFDFLDSMWDGLCSQSAPGLPPAPMPPFSGVNVWGTPINSIINLMCSTVQTIP